MSPRRALLIGLGIVVIGWALVPAVRGALLVGHGGAAWSGLVEHSEAVTFLARDGVRLSGTFVKAPNPAGTIVLVHGFRSGRGEMLDWLTFLYPTYSVLLFDSRGTGSSEGTFGVGATEDRDIVGAVDLVRARNQPGSDRIAVLGISLGAGDAIIAAAHDERIRAVVADSPWTDEFVQLERMHALAIGPVSVPLLPYEPALVAALIGGRLEDAVPAAVVEKIAPRSLLLIHALDDGNATTPAVGTERLFRFARDPKELWLVPTGGHVGAIRAQPTEYRQRVLSFLASALR